MGSQRAGLNWAHMHKVWGFTDGSAGKESTCNAGDAGDLGSVPRLGRSPVGGNGNPLQSSCLKNPTDRGAWQETVQKIAKNQHD